MGSHPFGKITMLTIYWTNYKVYQWGLDRLQITGFTNMLDRLQSLSACTTDNMVYELD